MRAVAYIWSPDNQKNDIALQREQCARHASRHGFELAANDVFQGVGITNEGAGKPELAALIAYCIKHEGGIHACIVPKADTIADNDEGYAIVGWQLARLGIRLVVIEDPRSNSFMNELDAALATTLNRLNILRKHAASYDYSPSPELRTLLLQYATGDYTIKQITDLARRLGLKNHANNWLTQQSVKQLLVSADEPMIDTPTRRRTQALASGHVKKYPDGAELDWPLRGLLRHTCGTLITASAPRGRNGPSPRYHCPGSCGAAVMSGRREAVHAQFIVLLTASNLYQSRSKVIWDKAHQTVASELNELHTRFAAEHGDDGAARMRQAQLSHQLSQSAATLHMLDLYSHNLGMFWNLLHVSHKVNVQSYFWPNGLILDFEDGFGTVKR